MKSQAKETIYLFLHYMIWEVLDTHIVEIIYLNEIIKFVRAEDYNLLCICYAYICLCTHTYIHTYL